MSGSRHVTNLHLVRQSNRALVFDAIRRFQPVSRIALAQRTQLTRASITNIVNEFVEAGLVHESGKLPSSAGRRSQLLSVNPSSGYAVGIDVSRFATIGVVCALDGGIVHKVTVSWRLAPNWDRFLEHVTAMVSRLLEETGVPASRLVGIGVAAPGPINLVGAAADSASLRRAKSRNSIPYNWSGAPLVESLGQQFGVLVYPDNNANDCALAERWYGVGRQTDNFISLIVGDGVGSGIILNGEVYHGAYGVAGEIGHATVDFGGELCTCGGRGCLELYTSFPSMIRRARALIATSAASKLKLDPKGGGLFHEIETLFQAAEQQDPVASRVVSETAEYLAMGVINLVNIINPEMVVIGSPYPARINLNLLVEPIRRLVRDHAFSATSEKVGVVSSELGPEAAALGAATQVLQKFADHPKRIESRSYEVIVSPAVEAGMEEMETAR